MFSCHGRPGADRRTSTVQADSSDAQLLYIAEDARRTLPIFFRYLSRPQPGMSNFSIKYPLMTDDDSGIVMEQVWLTGIHFRDGSYHGILADTPVHVSGIQQGDTITFDADSITDWMYTHNGTITGGRSIQYLLEQIPEHQRSDSQWSILGMFE